MTVEQAFRAGPAEPLDRKIAAYALVLAACGVAGFGVEVGPFAATFYRRLGELLLQFRAKKSHSVTWSKKSEKFVFGDSLRIWAEDQVEDMIGVGQGGEFIAFMDHDFVAVEACGCEVGP